MAVHQLWLLLLRTPMPQWVQGGMVWAPAPVTVDPIRPCAGPTAFPPWHGSMQRVGQGWDYGNKVVIG